MTAVEADQHSMLPLWGQRILVVAPHADDETLGVGGTMARFVQEGRHVTVAVMTGRGPDPHPFVTRESIAGIRAEFGRAMKVLGVQETLFCELPTTLLDIKPQFEINKIASDVMAQVRPDVVFLPFEHDLHKDHEILNYAFRVALRPHLPLNRGPHGVLSYETPTETHLQSAHLRPSFEPNVWVDISDHLDRKLEALSQFRSQIVPAPGLRSLQALEALARWRGSQVGVSAAESFLMLRQVM